MKQLEVTILGQTYILGCPDNGQQSLLEAVETVDREMSKIRDGGKVKARERIAVLAALNLAYLLAERRDGNGSPTTLANGDADGVSELNLSQLIQRVDQALNSGGQLV